MKAPPPSIPTNIFSPTESKVMDFPNSSQPDVKEEVHVEVVKPSAKV